MPEDILEISYPSLWMKTDTDNVSFMSVTTDKNMKKYRDKKKSLLLWCFTLEAWLPASWDENIYELTFIKFLCICIQGVNIFMEYTFEFNSPVKIFCRRERIIFESPKILETILEIFEHNSLLNNWNNYLIDRSVKI